MTDDPAPLPAPDPIAIDERAHDTAVRLRRPPDPGELTPAWRVITVCCWVGVAAAFAAIWNTSERLGLSTWWLGPRGEPMPVIVRLLPFVAPTLMVIAAANGVRWLGYWGIGAAVATAAFGLGDLGGFSGLAGLELVVAAAALLVSVASLTGTYRAVPEGTTISLR